MHIYETSAILLAAGFSHRMGKDKLQLTYRGKPLLQLAVDLLSALPVHEKILITVPSRSGCLSIPPEIRVAINAHPEEGQNGSLALGVRAATGASYLFLNADQPKLALDDILPLLEAASVYKNKIVYPLIYGAPCSPTLFPARFREDLHKLSGDSGGRPIREAHPQDCIAVAAQNPENFFDIDNDDDYMLLLGAGKKHRLAPTST